MTATMRPRREDGREDGRTFAWKVLDGTRSCNGGNGAWHRPHGNRPGKWMPNIPDLEPCVSGYHVCDDTTDLLSWLGPDIWIAEWRGDSVRDADKRVVSQARLIRHVDAWNERTARLFAAACAEDVLPIWEAQHPDDDRSRQSIAVARRFAEGEASRDELAAAWAAAWAAAGAAARAAAWAAARDAAGDAAWAAGAAARAAAGDAAWDAAWDAARAAARARQADRLTAIIGTLETV